LPDVAAPQKVHTVSRKSERLVNLTIALLATKRYLTKAEIFRTVAGYEGEPEARDRMFERDKEDLRSLGVEIEVGSHDPVFEDEAGYRIRPDRYSFQLPEITPTQGVLLAKAAEVWRDAALGEASSIALRKLKALGLESSATEIPDIQARYRDLPAQLPDLIEALTSRREILFEYLDEELKAKVRRVWPYHLSYTSNNWYLLAFDLDQADIRRFRLDRFVSEISFESAANEFESDPEGVAQLLSEIERQPSIATIALRVGKGINLRRGATLEVDGADWQTLSLPYFSEAELIAQILWLGADCQVLSPESLRDSLLSAAQRLRAVHV